MGRPKGGTNRYWSKNEKLRIVKLVLESKQVAYDVSKVEKISDGMLTHWIKSYLTKGEKGLENVKKPGNPLAKYQQKKQLNELEQLQYENMKLKIELERAKKGYLVEGDGRNKVFISLSGENSK